MNTEIEWKEPDDYYGLYEVSNSGLVRSKDRIGKRKGKLLTPKKHRGGYHFVQLCKNGKRKNHYVHRLVASTFNPNPENKPEVNHLNGIKTDNRSENLSWATHLENIHHAMETGLLSKRKRRMTWARCVKDLKRGLTYESLKEAAKYYGRSYSTLKSQMRRNNCDLPIEFC